MLVPYYAPKAKEEAQKKAFPRIGTGQQPIGKITENAKKCQKNGSVASSTSRNVNKIKGVRGDRGITYDSLERV